MCFTTASPRPVPRAAHTVGAEEPLEEPRQVLLGDADTVVGGAKLSGDTVIVNAEPGPAYRIAFWARFSVKTRSMRRAQRQRRLGSPSALSVTPARAAVSPSFSSTSLTKGSARVSPSATTARPVSSSLRKRMSSISSRISSTSPRAWSASAAGSSPGSAAVSSSARIGRAASRLVRDGRREPGAKLLVGSQLSGGLR